MMLGIIVGELEITIEEYYDIDNIGYQAILCYFDLDEIEVLGVQV